MHRPSHAPLTHPEQPPRQALPRRHWLQGMGCWVVGGLGASGWAGLARAQAQGQRVARVGVSKFVSHAALDADEKGFEAGLAASGFTEGVNITYVRRNAQGDWAKAQAVAQELEGANLDLVHAIATPAAQALFRSGGRTPLVFSSVTDPVRAQIVPAHSLPGQKTGTRVTGVSDLWPVQLQLETYARALPTAKAWGTIYNPAEANSVSHVLVMREAARQLGLTLHEATVNRAADVAGAAAGLAQRVQAFVITSDNTTVSNLEAVVQVCRQRKVPLFAGDVDSVARGAVMAYGLDYFLVGYAAGKKAAMVLKGIKPGDIPWGPMEKFSLVLNRAAAQAQGMVFAPELLARADKVFD